MERWMKKIQAMYKCGGGTDYRHTCHECKNCLRIQKGGRKVYKCRIYGESNSAASDWKASYIACRWFDRVYLGPPIMRMSEQKNHREEIQGQISMFDVMGEKYET